MCTTPRFYLTISLKICFSHSPDHNTFGLLQYQLQSQHEKCHLVRLHYFLLSPTITSLQRMNLHNCVVNWEIYFNSDRVKFITRHDGFMLNTSQLVINNYAITWRCINQTTDKEPQKIPRNTWLHCGRNKKFFGTHFYRSHRDRQTPCRQQFNYTAWCSEYISFRK